MFITDAYALSSIRIVTPIDTSDWVASQLSGYGEHINYDSVKSAQVGEPILLTMNAL